jgi:hypothetical protein
MARLIASFTETPQFRYLENIHNLSNEILESHGYYRGYPCAHGHLIRDSSHHWCYECVHKILSNVCGFDVSYLHADYKAKYAKLWNSITVRSPQECWLALDGGDKTPKRICLPSYRSGYSKQKSENLNIHKAVYQCAWGDVGSLPVTRLCGNKTCCNPLHLVSSWNRQLPPQTISPCETKFNAERLMLFNRRALQEKTIDPVLKRSYKLAITNPLYVPEPTDIHESNE